MGTLSLNNVKKSYGALQVIHGITLDVADAEFIALVGPSGCGKSTLLRMIAGLESISDGIVSIDDKVVNEVAPKDRDVAMVFQSYALYPHMTVRQNMAFALKMSGVKKEQANAEIKRAADILGLEPFLERKPKELSGGQMQRVAMGRCIVRNPKLFLFDEPLSNLDAKLRVKVRAEIQALHKRLNTTTVYVTHDQVEAMTLADRLVVMSNGNVEQIGTPLELYDFPATTFVAGFIGTPPMNLLEGTLTSSQEPFFTLKDGTKLQLPSDFANVKTSGKRTTIGIRPEQLTVAPHGWPMQIHIVETLGNETHIGGKIGDSDVIFTLTGRDIPAVGDMVSLAPQSGEMHLFLDDQRVELG